MQVCVACTTTQAHSNHRCSTLHTDTTICLLEWRHCVFWKTRSKVPGGKIVSKNYVDTVVLKLIYQTRSASTPPCVPHLRTSHARHRRQLYAYCARGVMPWGLVYDSRVVQSTARRFMQETTTKKGRVMTSQHPHPRIPHLPYHTDLMRILFLPMSPQRCCSSYSFYFVFPSPLIYNIRPSFLSSSY